MEVKIYYQYDKSWEKPIIQIPFLTFQDEIMWASRDIFVASYQIKVREKELAEDLCWLVTGVISDLNVDDKDKVLELVINELSAQ